MILHVLPGDAIVDAFKAAQIEGDIAVCREAFVDGDVSADSLPELWEQRARFHAAEDPGAADDYHEKVVREFAKMTALQSDSEIDLWFEYELFCNVNLWFCLSLLTESGSRTYRVMPVTLEENDRWNGFGQMRPEELKVCFERKVELTAEDVQLGANLWGAYRTQDHTRLSELSQTSSPAYPMLREVCAAAIEKDSRPSEIVRQAIHEGAVDFENVFEEFKSRAGIYGYGDSQVKKIWKELVV
jgi:hypothetical protein